MRQPQDPRRRNRREIAIHLREGRLTRPNLAETTRLSKVTLSATVQKRLEHGIVQVSGAQGGGAAGRHAQLVRFGPIGSVATFNVRARERQVQPLDLPHMVLSLPQPQADALALERGCETFLGHPNSLSGGVHDVA